MRMIFISVFLLSITLPSDAQDKKKKGDRRREVALKAGDVAPDFTLKDADGRNAVTLSKLKGKPVVLIFGSCT